MCVASGSHQLRYFVAHRFATAQIFWIFGGGIECAWDRVTCTCLFMVREIANFLCFCGVDGEFSWFLRATNTEIVFLRSYAELRPQCCVCVFLPIHSGHQVRWTYQPGSHRRNKVTQDFSSTFFFLRCVP